MNIKKNSIILVFALLFGLVACEPEELDKPGYDSPPSNDQVSFTITPGSDDFTFTLSNTSSVDGIAHWDLGNGVKVTGDEVTATYSFPGEFEVTLTLVTNGGQASASQTLTQTETDYSLLTDPLYLNLSGGTDSIDGRTWVLDSTSVGHLGVGPPEGTWPEWWAAAPLQKQGVHMYDDEINFNIIDFVATYENHGKSYVKAFQIDNPAYSNPVENDGDYIVDYATPVTGTWAINTVDEVNYLAMNAATPIFPNFDVGAENNTYEIQSITENELKLRCIGGDGSAWYYILIPKGYTRPVITYDFTITETANPNEYEMQITDLVVPEGVSITNITWAFDNPMEEDYQTTDPAEVVTHTYMQMGTYNVAVTIEDTEGGVFTETQELVVEEDHPSYVPYIENGMAMYINFDDIFRPINVDEAGGTAYMEIVSNPLINLDNESQYAVQFTKESSEWSNIYIQLSDAYRFDFAQSTKFKLLVYGNAGDEVLLKVENTDLGPDAWTTGAEVIYTIQESNTWEIAEYDFTGVGTAQGQTDDITTDPTYSSDYYNVVRVMINPGDGGDTYSVIIDDWAGLLVPGWKSSKK